MAPTDPSADSKPFVPGLVPGVAPSGDKIADIKGVAVRGSIEFIRAKKGDAGVAEALSRLPDEMRTAFSKPILATDYYPLPWLIALQVAACEVIGGNRNDILFEMGRHACAAALTGVYRIFVKLGSPEYFFKKSSQVFNNYFRGTEENHVQIVEQEKGYGRVQMKRLPGGSPDYCRRLDGYFEMILELSGAKKPKVVHSMCAFRGGDCCEWTGRWS